MMTEIQLRDISYLTELRTAIVQSPERASNPLLIKQIDAYLASIIPVVDLPRSTK